mmetsp:Transcript_10110/g.19217  ORF Transcript_10110/g.19217 Transcript_10110/m.19217 type:complete len:198 (+) Transcript_10110:12-605(+)
MLTWFLFLVAVAAFGEQRQASAVIELNENNFDHMSDVPGAWLVKFYAQWCGACQSAAPAYEKAGELVKDKAIRDKINFGKVNVDTNKDLASRFRVKSYPTFIFFKEGKMHYMHLDTPRTLESFLGFVTGDYKTQPALDIPPKQAFLEKLFETLWLDAEEMWQFKKNLTIAIFALGTLFGVFLSFCCRKSMTEKTKTN